MPFKTPPAPPEPVMEITQEMLFGIVSGFLSPDPYVQRETIARFCAPECKWITHLSKIDNRWDSWRQLYAVSTLFELRLEHHTSCLDKTGLKGMVYLDELFKPRIPLVSWALPEIRCPVVFHMQFTKHPQDGRLLITEVLELHSTMYLFNLLGPVGSWAHSHLIQPAGRIAMETVADATAFAQAFKVFVQKQILGKNGPARFPGNNVSL